MKVWHCICYTLGNRDDQMTIISLRPVQTGGLGSVFFYLSPWKHLLPNSIKNNQQGSKSKRVLRLQLDVRFIRLQIAHYAGAKDLAKVESRKFNSPHHGITPSPNIFFYTRRTRRKDHLITDRPIAFSAPLLQSSLKHPTFRLSISNDCEEPPFHMVIVQRS